MKYFQLALISAAFLNSAAFAQTNTENPNNTADGSSRPSHLKLRMPKVGKINLGDWRPFTRWVLNRLHTAEIQQLASQQIQQGVQERNYVAGFSATGAMMYEYELKGKKLADFASTGRNAGMQIIPFTVSIANPNQYYVSVSPFAFRNMNSLQNSPNYWKGEMNQIDRGKGFWSVVDNIDFLIFKFDNNAEYSNSKSFEFRFVDVSAKLDLLNSKVPARYLAIKVGGSAGYKRVERSIDGKPYYFSTSTIAENTGDVKWSYGYGPAAAAGYGLEYNDETSKGFRINVSAMMQNKWYNVFYTSDLKTQNAGVDGGRSNHTSMYFKPEIEVSKRVSAADAVKPRRLGLGLSANLPLRDRIQTTGPLQNGLDMSQYNNQLVKLRLFVNF